MNTQYTSISYVAVYDGKKKMEKTLEVKNKKVHYTEKVNGKVTKDLKDAKKIKQYLLKEKPRSKSRSKK